MSERGPIWRSILWVERFLPTLAPALPKSEQAAVARRRAAFVPLVVVPFVLIPALLRNRHELGMMLRENIVVFQQILLGFVILSALAVVIAGVVTWRAKSPWWGDRAVMRVQFWIALIVFVAALVHLVASIEGIRWHWLALVSLVLTVGTFALVVLRWRNARNA
ncbi:hypothetical protein [uncultured Sphingomonas sp.]|uniref:hypothetical protein n=1 Tax=uncultured Sphingomonas sp. TaxID=158754 RepID=UPI0035C948F9